MKKRIGSLVLTLCMVLTLIPTAAIPVRADVSYEDFSGTWAELKTKMAAGGNFKLNADVTAGSGDEALEVPSGKTVILDLAGHTIDRGLSGETWPQAGGSVIVIANGGTLTLNDSSGTNAGKITGGAAGNGGGVCVGSGSTGSQANFTMNGGTITDNIVFPTSDTTGRGGGVYISGKGVFTMTGGAITGNTTKYTDSNGINRSGQAIGGGVYHDGVFWVSGSARIVENHAISKGTGTNDPEITRTENVYLLSDKNIYVNNTLNADALIGVTIAGGATRVFTSANSRSNNDLTKFFSDNSKYTIIKNSNNDLEMVDSPTVTTWSDLKAKLAEDGTVMLGANITYASGDPALTVPSGKTVILDLNGYTIDRNLSTATSNGYVIKIEGSLTLNDSSENKTGTITGGYNSSSGSGGGVFVDGDGGVFTMNGGTITGGKASSGGGVYIDHGTLTMNGGNITGNTATSSSTANSGGGGVFNSFGTLTMTGGSITNNITNGTEGGGVYLNGSSAKLSLSGAVNISNNYKGGSLSGSTASGGTANNVYLNAADDSTNKTIRNNMAIVIAGTLASDATIGVSPAPAFMAYDVPFSKTGTNAAELNDLSKFESDNKDYVITQNDSGELVMSKLVGDWATLSTELTKGTAAYPHHITLSDNVTAASGEERLQVGSGETGANAVLDLAGHTIDRALSGSDAVSNGEVLQIYSNSVLTLRDSSETKTGKITGGNSTSNAGGVFMNATATFNMEGGTITGNATDKSGGGVYLNAGGVFNMSGGSITGNKVGNSGINMGGGVGVASGACTFKVSGNARITRNVKGDGVTYDSTAKAYTGGRANNVYLLGDNKITVAGELGENASIGVYKNAATITNTASENADAWNDPTKFTSDTDNYTIEKDATTKQLKFVTAPTVMTWSSVKAALAAGQNVTLTNSIEDTNNEGALEVPSGATVTLDLAGFTIDRKQTTAEADGYVIKVVGTMTVKDSSTGKTGKITGGNSTTNAGGVFMGSSATFNMEGGTISGNTATSGGGIYMAGGTFTMSGGTITRNSTTGTDSGIGNGGGVNAFNGTFTMSGGEISNNTASRYGGGAEVKTFTMSGGTISGNTATDGEGGGVFVDTGGTLKLSGNPTISGNKKGDADNNVGLLGGTKITVTDTLTYSTPIGVTMKTPGVFTSGLSGKGGIGKFTSDSASYTVVEDNGEAKLAAQYTVTYDANGGTGTMAAGTAFSGVAFTLPANSFTAPTGKQFKAWSIDGTEYAAGSTYTFTDNTTVTAVWEDIPASSYTISIAGGISNGTVTASASSAAAGTEITLTAMPSSGYELSAWSVIDASNNSVAVTNNQFTMPASNVTVSATFEAVAPSTHSISITPDANMTASSGSSSQTVAAGSAMTDVVYTANTGYFFPDSYSVSAVSDVTVTRNSVSQITVSGTPTGDVSLSLTAPTQLNAISVKSSTHKTSYTVGDSLDVSGLVIALNAPAAATVTVTADMVSGFNSSTAGTKTLTITYGGKTTTYIVTINNAVTPSRPFYIAPEDEEKEEPEQPAQHFTDVADAAAWYYDAVYYGYDKGYFAGVSATEFAPSSTMTRAMFATVIYNMAGKPEVAASDSFPDVAAGKWYTNGVLWGVAQGIISGYSDGAFGTTDPVTREQMAVLLWNYAGKPTATADLSKFADADQISAYARNAMNWAVFVGVISGKGNGILDPKSSATRAEVAQIVMNFDLAGE